MRAASAGAMKAGLQGHDAPVTGAPLVQDALVRRCPSATGCTRPRTPPVRPPGPHRAAAALRARTAAARNAACYLPRAGAGPAVLPARASGDRESDVSGKSVSVRIDVG